MCTFGFLTMLALRSVDFLPVNIGGNIQETRVGE